MINFIKNHPGISIIIVIILLIAGRIVYVQINSAKYDIHIKGIEVSKSSEWLIIIYDNNIQPEDILDYSVFNGLNPYMNLDEYDSFLGYPFNIREENETINFYEYRTSIGEVTVCDGYEKLETGIEPIRYIEIKPLNTNVKNLLLESIFKIIKEDEDIIKVSIMNKNYPHSNFVTIQLKNNLIDFIRWYD